ncbi:hypothetical protein KUL118_66820 [Tenacibaculum sp. KUL118]|nr:hypothetical protein KUL118_66820 [Tenacibaculum sp. KUL118]
MQKAVAYIRISSKEQDLKRQHEAMLKFASRKKLELVKVFEDIISASKKDRKLRKGFNEMDDFLEANKDIKHLLVIEVSRLGREQLEVLKTIDEYHKNGINIHIKDLDLSTLDDKGEKNYVSGMIISILAKMAENETRLLGERIKSGKEQKAREGYSFNAKITGYKKDKEGKPVVDKEIAPIVKRMFELAAKGIGMRGISEVISDEFKASYSMGTISGILRNSFYKGARESKNENIKIQPLVDEELWNKANDSIDSKKHFASRRYVHPNIVQGKIFCGVCGNPMYQAVILSARSNLYRCKNTKCSNSINRPWLQEVIKQVVESYAVKTREEKVRKQIEDEIEVMNSRINNALDSIKKKASIKTNLTINFASEYIDRDDYNKAMKVVASDIKKLEDNLAYYKKQKNNFESSLNDKTEHFSSNLEVLKNQIRDIVHLVKIFEEEVEINMSFASITIRKPNPAKLGWLKRKMKNNEGYGDLINNVYLITLEELENIEIMVNSMDLTDEQLEEYFKSEEYLKKMKGIKSLPNNLS